MLQKEENSPLWHVIVAASLRLSLSPPPVLFCFSAGPGFRRCAARKWKARFLVSGGIQTFGYRGATYRSRASPALADASYQHYINILQTDFSCTFLPCLFIIITTKSHRLFIHLYKVFKTTTLSLF